MQLADLGIWPILVLWAVFALIGNAGKKKRQAGQAAPPREPEAARQGGMMEELRRAMEELKRAEQQAQRQSPAQQQQQQQQLRPPPRAAASQTDRERAQAEQAARWIKKQQARAAARQVTKRSVRPLEAVDDRSSETIPPEPADYDEDAERVIQARLKAADRAVREDVSVEGLSRLQLARREARQAAAIGGADEHAAWHGELGTAIGDAGSAPPARRAGRLAAYADGSNRGAMILSELLAPPVGQRNQ